MFLNTCILKIILEYQKQKQKIINNLQTDRYRQYIFSCTYSTQVVSKLPRSVKIILVLMLNNF